MLEEKSAELVSPASYTPPYLFHTFIFPIPTEHKHTNTQTFIGYIGSKPRHQKPELLFSQVQNVEFTHPDAGCSGKRQERTG